MSNVLPRMEYTYRPEWFIGRKEPLAQTLQWASDSSLSRIMLITAPPKTGKSWFLGRLKELFLEQSISFTFIDITKHLNQEEKRSELDLKEVVKELSGQLNILPPNQLADLVAHLQERIVPAIPPHLQFAIFDGLDEVPEADWEKFQSVILNSLFKRSSLRFIVAAREEFRLAYPLNKSLLPKSLPAFDHDEAQAHLSKLTQEPPSPIDQQNTLMHFGLDPDYQWDHAGTNTFIYKCIEQNIHPFPVDDYLKQLEVVSEEQLQETKELLEIVFSINKVEWTADDFSTAYTALKKTSLSSIASGQKMFFLVFHSLVNRVKGKPRYFKTAFGLSVIAPLLG